MPEDDASPLPVGSPAPDVPLADHRTAEPVAPSSLWDRRGLVLVFLRHFG